MGNEDTSVMVPEDESITSPAGVEVNVPPNKDIVGLGFVPFWQYVFWENANVELSCGLIVTRAVDVLGHEDAVVYVTVYVPVVLDDGSISPVVVFKKINPAVEENVPPGVATVAGNTLLKSLHIAAGV